MFAILAVLAFALALILHVLPGVSYGSLVTTFELAGLLCVALHLLCGTVIPIRRPGPPS